METAVDQAIQDVDSAGVHGVSNGMDDQRNYYTYSAAKPHVFPKLVGDEQAQVVVVGGGLTGLSAALHMARSGYDTVLCEARSVGYGASGRNGGQIIPGMRHGAASLTAQFGETRARMLFRATLDARALLGQLIDAEGIDCDLRSGHISAAVKPRHMKALEEEYHALRNQFGYDDMHLLGRADMRASVRTNRYVGGLADPLGGHLHPLKFVHGLADAAARAGVRIYENSVIRTLDPDGQGRVARTATGSVDARYAVLACDSYIGRLEPRLARRIMPIGNYMVATRPLGTDMATALIPSGAAIADTNFVLDYFRLSADNRLLFSGGERYTRAAPSDIAAFVRPHLLRVFPQLADTPIEYAWGGIVGVTTSRFPHIGRYGDLFFAHGYSGHGLLMSVFAGKVIAEAMAGTAERFDLLASLPTREWPGGTLLRHPLFTLGALWYAIRDRL